MSRASELSDLVKPWAGLIGGITAATLGHQIGADGTFDHCDIFAPNAVIWVNFLCIVVAAVGALPSLAVWRDDNAERYRRVIAIISGGMAGLAIFALLLPMASALILPPCFQ